MEKYLVTAAPKFNILQTNMSEALGSVQNLEPAWELFLKK